MGYGGASSSYGARGDGGSAGAFSGNGLRTGSTWYGTKAYFDGGGNLQGYSSRSGGGYDPRGQAASSYGSRGQGGANDAFAGVNANWRDPMGRSLVDPRSQPSPGGYAEPVLSQPIPPRAPGYVPPPVAPPGMPPVPGLSFTYPQNVTPNPQGPGWGWRNPTGYPQHATGWRQGYSATQTPPGETGPSTGWGGKYW